MALSLDILKVLGYHGRIQGGRLVARNEFQDKFSSSDTFDFAEGSVFGFRYFWFDASNSEDYLALPTKTGPRDINRRKTESKSVHNFHDRNLVGAREVPWETSHLEAQCQQQEKWCYCSFYRIPAVSPRTGRYTCPCGAYEARYDSHDPPGAQCACGIYGYWQPISIVTGKHERSRS